jgi:hypothetical protein
VAAALAVDAKTGRLKGTYAFAAGDNGQLTHSVANAGSAGTMILLSIIAST